RLTSLVSSAAGQVARAFPPFRSRRSSDLGPHRTGGARGPDVSRAAPPSPRERIAYRAFATVGSLGRALPTHAGRRRETRSVREVDRKVTRLNSSHEWISYAVLCLTKNNAD